MQLKRQKVIKGLRKLDGVKSLGGKHTNYKFYLEGRFFKKIPVPDEKEFNNTLIKFVAKKLFLNNRNFLAICICDKDKDWYCEHLKSQDKL